MLGWSRRVFLPGLFVLALVALPARAQGAMALRWDECLEGGGNANKLFACGVLPGDMVLVPTVRLAAAVDSVVSVEWVIDLVSSSSVLPDWWQVGSGGCRAGELRASADFAGLGGCADPWAGNAVALLQVYAPGSPRGGLNQARIIATTSVLPSQAARWEANEPYYLGLVRLGLAKSTGVNACPGCITDVCLVLNSARFVMHPASATAEFSVAPEHGVDPHIATWQGTTADCQLVPVRQRTWGAIKSLYR